MAAQQEALAKAQQELEDKTTKELEDQLVAELACIQVAHESLNRQGRFLNTLKKSVQDRCPHRTYNYGNYDEWSGQWWTCSICGHSEQGSQDTPPKPKKKVS